MVPVGVGGLGATLGAHGQIAKVRLGHLGEIVAPKGFLATFDSKSGEYIRIKIYLEKHSFKLKKITKRIIPNESFPKNYSFYFLIPGNAPTIGQL